MKTHVYSASLILVLALSVFLASLFARGFAMEAQDRAIRAEENPRHFVLTGKPLDSRLSMRQVVALALRAAQENISETGIKKAVKNWKADTHRV